MRESLSRYDSDLLLGLRPALFYGIGSMLRIRIQVAQLKRLSFEGRFFCFYRCWCKRVVVPTIVVAVHLSLDASTMQDRGSTKREFNEFRELREFRVHFADLSLHRNP